MAQRRSAALLSKLAPSFLLVVPLALGCADERASIDQRAAALTTTSGLAADAYVRSGSFAAQNFGTATSVQIDGDDVGTLVHGYVRFAVGNVGAISSAKLRLFITNASPGPNEVRRVSNTAWSESGITWNNKPAVDGALVTTLGAVAANSWVEIDLTGIAQPNSTVTLAFLPGTPDGMDFSSREATSNRPQLVIESAGTTGAGGSGGAGGTGGSGGAPSTDPGLKIAFVGDTADGANYTAVLNLIKREGAQAIVTAGDMTYTANPAAWWTATEAVIGQTFPIFLARGNHDDTSWSGFLSEAATHLGGATRVAGPHDAAYKTQFHGLDLVTVMKGDTGTTVTNLFGGDAHVWKVCSWHQNQTAMQVGGKGDEMGWDVYETCRRKGAIVITGHEHTYHRTRTMTNTQTQTIDGTCSSGSSVCVGPGRTFVTVVGTGGTGLRAQVRCTPTASTAPYASLNTSDPSCPIWASIYTTNQGAAYGAQFITFNVDGNPKKAHAYFKDINNVVVDSFDIFAD